MVINYKRNTNSFSIELLPEEIESDNITL